MSVGAGSIKRAAKTAEGSMETKAVESTEVKAAKGSRKTSAKKSGEKVSTGNKTSIAAKPASADSKAENGKTAYVTYGVGQELPIYLM